MGITIIKREIKADRRRRLYERPAPVGVNLPIEGIARNIDEAHDIHYHTHGELDKPFVVEAGPERYRAFEKDMLRIGKDPEHVARQWNVKKE